VRAIKAETFTGYGGLRQVELPKPQAGKDRVLVHVTAAGVTPLDHTILAAAPRPQRLADVSPIRPASAPCHRRPLRQ
jgi:NADPH:quinone reductase-like Zn-dependent oxidoreductase